MVMHTLAFTELFRNVCIFLYIFIVLEASHGTGVLVCQCKRSWLVVGLNSNRKNEMFNIFYIMALVKKQIAALKFKTEQAMLLVFDI